MPASHCLAALLLFTSTLPACGDAHTVVDNGNTYVLREEHPAVTRAAEVLGVELWPESSDMVSFGMDATLGDAPPAHSIPSLLVGYGGSVPKAPGSNGRHFDGPWVWLYQTVDWDPDSVSHNEIKRNPGAQKSDVSTRTYIPEPFALESTGHYAAGQRTGEWTFYHPDGTLRARGTFEAGTKVGPWQVWKPDGSIDEEHTLDHGGG